jgi:hypothetical protein
LSIPFTSQLLVKVFRYLTPITVHQRALQGQDHVKGYPMPHGTHLHARRHNPTLLDFLQIRHADIGKPEL